MITNKKTKEPYINVWFGNFYKPAFDDKDFVKESISLLKDLGFNSISLDSKAWEDFRDRFAGKEASAYVEMQEYMQEEMKKQGISHEFLSLYLNGDNLYPNIRFSKPIYGESVTTIDGGDGKWYKYWSDDAKNSMLEHVTGLLDTYSDNHTMLDINGEERMPMCSMWDPIVAPSFDEDGINRYRKWLKNEYKNIEIFNEKYKLNKKDFDDINPEDYWFEERYEEGTTFTNEDVENEAPKVYVLSDNQKWKNDELKLYFEDMQEKLHAINNKLYIHPCMAQWGYFFNIDGSMLKSVGFSDLWDTSVRGIDVYSLSKYVDVANFTSLPITPFGDPDVYVTVCNNNMLRNMNRNSDFLGGIYWGRFLYNHIYATITPCEVIGSIVASKASGYLSYGMCGLDDGGVLNRMESYFNDSLAKGNKWAKDIIPMLGELEKAEVGILFPSAMSLFETMAVENNKERRLDTLGFYKAITDFGCASDVVDMEILLDGNNFNQYKVLIIPNDDCYKYQRNLDFEEKLNEWVNNGGTVIHSPYCDLVKFALGVNRVNHSRKPIIYNDVLMVESTNFSTYVDMEPFVKYTDETTAIGKKEIGDGMVYSMGFDYGYTYIAKIAPHVPLEEKNNELYPLPLMKENLLKNIIEDSLNKDFIYDKDIEKARYDNGIVIVNHTSYPYHIDIKGEKYYQYDVNESVLLPRSAVFIKY